MRRQRRGVIRTVQGPKGLLQGMISCGNCGSPIQSDRHRFGAPMYRERHAVECDTNGRSVIAQRVDDQIGVILQAVELRPEWRKRITQLAVSDQDGPGPRELQERRRRISRAYAEGASSDVAYEQKLAEVDALIRSTNVMGLPTIQEVAELFENIPTLWMEATPAERRMLLSPLIERVYVDMGTKLVGAITPVPAFRTIPKGAMTRTDNSPVALLSGEETDETKVWSWWRRGRVELPVHKSPRQNMLQAYLVFCSRPSGLTPAIS